MRIYGIDFTSTPRFGKAITLAKAELRDKELIIINCENLTSTAEFSELLKTPGPWIAAIDFPFGQPRKLVLDCRWPRSWEGYVEYVSKMGKRAFEERLRSYKDTESGRRRLRRKTDIRAGSLSPMQLDFTPVGKMFFVGAPLLLRSPCTIMPFRVESTEAGIIVEGYPKLVAVKAIGRQGYKSDIPIAQNSRHREIRNSILKWIQSPAAQYIYGLSVGLAESVVLDCLDDAKGDKLDAVLCAIQAAWSLSQRQAGYGIPHDCDLLEGWIVDPSVINTITNLK
ncbi:DUF429 domain-containing protein [Chloroflexota bacterium]